jgi:hypothetical protein
LEKYFEVSTHIRTPPTKAGGVVDCKKAGQVFHGLDGTNPYIHYTSIGLLCIRTKLFQRLDDGLAHAKAQRTLLGVEIAERQFPSRR